MSNRERDDDDEDLPPFDGLIEAADPETGAPDLMGYWLPPGVTAADLGLTSGIVGTCDAATAAELRELVVAAEPRGEMNP